jgi:hypothetical protein
MKDFYISVVRSVVPALVASVLDWFAHIGLNLDANGVGALEALLFSVLYGSYYVIIRLFEIHVHPKLGWLLGHPSQPDYSPTPNVTDMLTPDPANAK